MRTAIDSEIECAMIGLELYEEEQRHRDTMRLLEEAEDLARVARDGHLTLMRFTTGWKVMLGTPDVDAGTGRDEIECLRAYPTLSEALRGLLRRDVKAT